MNRANDSDLKSDGRTCMSLNKIQNSEIVLWIGFVLLI